MTRYLSGFTTNGHLMGDTDVTPISVVGKISLVSEYDHGQVRVRLGFRTVLWHEGRREMTIVRGGAWFWFHHQGYAPLERLISRCRLLTLVYQRQTLIYTAT